MRYVKMFWDYQMSELEDAVNEWLAKAHGVIIWKALQTESGGDEARSVTLRLLYSEQASGSFWAHPF